MIKCIVKVPFNINEESIKKYGKITNIERVGREKENEYYVNDKFECSEKMGKYLAEENDFTKANKKPLIKVIEVIPEKKKTKTSIKKEAKEKNETKTKSKK